MAISDVKLGACEVWYGATTATLVNLGVTKGGVEVEVDTETYTVMVDQYGNSPIKEYITARSCMVRAPLAETSLANIEALIPGAQTLENSGSGNKVQVQQGIGTDLQASAKLLVLKPVASETALGVTPGTTSGNDNDNFVVPQAGLKGNLSYAFKLDEERIFNVEFTAYPDSNNNGVLFIVGDHTV